MRKKIKFRRIKGYVRKAGRKKIFVKGYRVRIASRPRRRRGFRASKPFLKKVIRSRRVLRPKVLKRKVSGRARRPISKKIRRGLSSKAGRKISKKKIVRRFVKKVPPKKKLPVAKALPRWVRVPQYVSLLEKEIGEKIIVVDPIYRVTEVPQSLHWVRLKDKLVWEQAKDPGFNRTVVVITVWILVYDEQDHEHKILSRSRAYGLRQQFYEGQQMDRFKRRPLIPSPKTQADLLALRDDLYSQFRDWAQRRDYQEERGLIAWTFWYTLTYAPRKEQVNDNPHPEG